MSWLDPLREALDQASHAWTFFFRDDDVGWGDQALPALLDLFAERELPLDLAAIPMALTPGCAGLLRERVAATRGRIGVHQHGFRHLNHEPEGRKWEFGPARSAAQQWTDIARGQQRLAERLGAIAQPVFTPPWNRCTEATGGVLRDLGFLAVSRDASAPSLHVPGLYELPIHVDWHARRKGLRLSRHELGERLAAGGGRAPTGVMFHHAVMDEADRRAASELLDLLACHTNARCVSMLELLAMRASAGAVSEARP